MNTEQTAPLWLMSRFCTAWLFMVFQSSDLTKKSFTKIAYNVGKVVVFDQGRSGSRLNWVYLNLQFEKDIHTVCISYKKLLCCWNNWPFSYLPNMLGSNLSWSCIRIFIHVQIHEKVLEVLLHYWNDFYKNSSRVCCCLK